MCHQQVTPVATEEDPGIERVTRPAPASRDEVPEDGGAATSPAPAQPQEDRLRGVVPAQGDSGASQDDGTGDLGPHHSAHPDTSTLQDREAGAIPQPHGDHRLSVQDMQHPSPSPTSLDTFASSELGVKDSGDSHSGHHPS